MVDMCVPCNGVDTVYAPHRTVTNLEDCWFYHTMELPGYGLISGDWDLRQGMTEYLGQVPLKGKRVLELGTASGCICFHMEQQGAEVVAYDLAEEFADDRDIVPFHGMDWRNHGARGHSFMRKLNNSWWLSHAAFQSQARVVYGSVYQIPKEIGMFDVGLFGCILLHLRDPFRALANAATHVRDTMIVTETLNSNLFPQLPPEPDWESQWSSSPWRRIIQRLCFRMIRGPLQRRFQQITNYVEKIRAFQQDYQALPVQYFYPNYRKRYPTETWWYITPQLMCEFLGVLGFPNARVTYHTQLFKGHPAPMYTVVAHRE
ncbi:MAG: class I SAM-dependent methyltransferase [Gemmataceae bacterium]